MNRRVTREARGETRDKGSKLSFWVWRGGRVWLRFRFLVNLRIREPLLSLGIFESTPHPRELHIQIRLLWQASLSPGLGFLLEITSEGLSGHPALRFGEGPRPNTKLPEESKLPVASIHCTHGSFVGASLSAGPRLCCMYAGYLVLFYLPRRLGHCKCFENTGANH